MSESFLMPKDRYSDLCQIWHFTFDRLSHLQSFVGLPGTISSSIVPHIRHLDLMLYPHHLLYSPLSHLYDEIAEAEPIQTGIAASWEEQLWEVHEVIQKMSGLSTLTFRLYPPAELSSRCFRSPVLDFIIETLPCVVGLAGPDGHQVAVSVEVLGENQAACRWRERMDGSSKKSDGEWVSGKRWKERW